MLALRPNCECCDRDLPPESRDAMMCTFECTFCKDCAERPLKGSCPNCGGEFVRRPIRPADNAFEVSGLDRTQIQAAGLRGGLTSRAWMPLRPIAGARTATMLGGVRTFAMPRGRGIFST